MGIFDFFKKEKPDKEVEKIFGKMVNVQQAKAIVDKAISFRNLGQYDKAITLLKETLINYPVYTPAKMVLGTTLEISGDIDGAESQFKKILSEHVNGTDYPLIEVYANLGSLYYNHKKDIKTSMKYYELALNAPKAKIIDDEAYKFMVSNVHRDLCMIYFGEKNFPFAKQNALKRLQILKDCPIASRVYGCCLFFELLQKGIDLDKDTENLDLENIVKYLQITIENQPIDYGIVAYCALSLFYMRQTKFYKKNPTLIKSLEHKEYEYIEHLKKNCGQSDNAKEALKLYQDIVSKTSTSIDRASNTLSESSMTREDDSWTIVMNEDTENINLFREDYPDIYNGVQKLLAGEYKDDAVQLLREDYPDIYEGIIGMISTKWSDESVKLLENQYPDIYIAIKKLIEQGNTWSDKKEELEDNIKLENGKDRIRFYEDLEKQVPDWENINKDPKFIEWLNEKDDLYAEKTKMDLIKEAYETLDAQMVAFFFKQFIGLNKRKREKQ
jgi:tetratricopeptide (TPR) repeat protein